jgi:predicted phosphodiesterase
VRIFAVSDVHADFEPNARWLRGLSLHDHQRDVLILAGDVTDSLPLLAWCLELVARRFHKVLFVPGNHELWTLRDRPRIGSFEKFERIREVVRDSGASMETFRTSQLAIVPLLAWYDYSFGTPSRELKEAWMDFHACRWPAEWDAPEITARFLTLNESALTAAHTNVISFSHFLPRSELVPRRGAAQAVDLSPVLGAAQLDRQVRRLGSILHVYGHSHVNRRLEIDAVTYVNNAFGYPHESAIAAKRLACVFEL